MIYTVLILYGIVLLVYPLYMQPVLWKLQYPSSLCLTGGSAPVLVTADG